MKEPLADARLEAAADALRQYEQGGSRSLVFWNLLPNTTKNKWRDKARIVIAAYQANEGERL